MQLKKINLLWPMVTLAIIAGIYARFTQLEWHFSHPDDVGVARTIIKSKLTGNFDIFAVSNYWTYAPFQFLFTNFLISTGDTYRDFLFWGRLPSAIFNSLSLPAGLFFFYLWDRFKSGSVVLGIALLACSFESIIFAKQMSSYGLGVTAAVILLIVLIWMARKTEPSLRDFCIMASILAFCGWLQYQVLFFMPAVFIAVWLAYVKDTASFISNCFKLFLTGLLYLALVAPLLYFFVLQHPLTGAYIWSDGVNLEFSYMPWVGMTHLQWLRYTVTFFLSNLLIVFDANTAFMLAESSFYHPVMWFLSLCFILALFCLPFSRDKLKRTIGIYALVVFITWFTLVALDRISFSPTRHSLIFMPTMVVLIVSGFRLICEFLMNAAGFDDEKRARIMPRVFTLMAAVVLFIFAMNLPNFLEQRRDVFIESEILETLKEYKADSVLMLRDTAQADMMRDVKAYINNIDGEKSNKDRMHPYQRIAWISRMSKMHPNKLKEIVAMHNQYLLEYYRQIPRIEGRPHPLDKFPYTYDIIYSKEIESDVEIDFSNRTKNGTNALYLYILAREVYPKS